MKNIHLIPTDKPSRLIIYSTLLNEFRLLNEPYEDWKHKRHIYITNDEEIKEGEWFICNNTVKQCMEIRNHNTILFLLDRLGNEDSIKYCKKIILTTDVDLIKDGVQAIDDEFLKWFVKNPSCEEVVVENIPNNNWGFDLEEPMTLGYKIIIPKEEPKQFCENCKREISKYGCACGKPKEEPKQEYICYKCQNKTNNKFEICDKCNVGWKEPKQETLEEAAKKYANNEIKDRGNDNDKLICCIDFIEGAKWMQERYSKMDIINITCDTIDYEMRKYAIEGFKKK